MADYDKMFKVCDYIKKRGWSLSDDSVYELAMHMAEKYGVLPSDVIDFFSEGEVFDSLFYIDDNGHLVPTDYED